MDSEDIYGRRNSDQEAENVRYRIPGSLEEGESQILAPKLPKLVNLIQKHTWE